MDGGFVMNMDVTGRRAKAQKGQRTSYPVCVRTHNAAAVGTPCPAGAGNT